MPELDADGILRPDDPHSHSLAVPVVGVKKIDKKKHLISGNPIRRFFRRILRFLILLFFTPAFWLKYRLRVENKKVLKKIKKSGAIMVGNHCHMLDAMFFAMKVAPRMNWITSRPENFQIPVAGGILKTVGAIPIPYDIKGMRLFFEVVDERLQKKQMLTFFPEGSMWPYYRSLRPFKNGAFRFAARNNVPVLPAVTVMRIKHVSKTKKKHRMRFVFLDPVYPDPALSVAESAEAMKQAAYEAMKQRIEAEREKDIYTKKYTKETMDKQ